MIYEDEARRLADAIAEQTIYPSTTFDNEMNSKHISVSNERKYRGPKMDELQPLRYAVP